MLTTIDGKLNEAAKIYKLPHVPPGVKIIASYGLFGKPDALFIIESENESAVLEFVSQFGSVAVTQTSLAFPSDEFKWTRRA
jgi:uncharacterized protein with GYD domain